LTQHFASVQPPGQIEIFPVGQARQDLGVHAWQVRTEAQSVREELRDQKNSRDPFTPPPRDLERWMGLAPGENDAPD
jgi:hypothetical protein